MEDTDNNNSIVDNDYTWPCGCECTFIAEPTEDNPMGVVGEVHTPCFECSDDAEGLGMTSN